MPGSSQGMPELPEVENSRRQFEKHAVGRRVASVVAADDDKVLVAGRASTIAACEGHLVQAARRKGKHVWLELGSDDGATSSSVCFHQGMTGAFTVRGHSADGVQYKEFAVDAAAWPPKHAKLVLTLSDGGEIAFTNSRRFGRIRIFDRALAPGEGPVAALGWDPLLERPSEQSFVDDLAARTSRRAVKSLLLDQSYIAGVGNWIGDEVLYHAGVHPATPTNALNDAARRSIYASLAAVVDTAVAANADARLFPPSWLFHFRWTKKRAGSLDFHGRSIQFCTVGGRTSAVVLERQRKRGWTAPIAPFWATPDGADEPNSAAPALAKSLAKSRGSGKRARAAVKVVARIVRRR